MSTSQTTPDGFVCPACRYDMSASANWTCPECGQSYTFEDGAMFVARRPCRALALRLAIWQLVAGVCLCAVAAVVWAVSIGDLFTGMATGAACCLIFFSSFLVGSFIALRARRPERAGWAAAWLESHVWLQAPWAGQVLLAVCLKCGAFALGSAFGNSTVHALSNWVAAIGACLWLAAAFGGLGLWFKTYHAGRRRYMLADRMAITYYPLLAFFAYVASALLGLAMGIMVFHIEPFPAQQ